MNMNMNTHRYTVERNVREETNDYGKAGAVEWRLIDPHGECIDIHPLKRDAKAHCDRCNAALAEK